MKRFFAAMLALLTLLTLCACAQEGEATTTEEALTLVTQETETKEETETKGEVLTDKTPIRLMALKGPTGMGLSALLHNDAEGSGNKVDYEAELVNSSEISNIGAAMIKGECDIAAVPINLASTLYAKTKGQVEVLCANTLGVLYMLENGESVSSVADLKGKTIYATGKASTPEYVLRYVLKENGIDPDQDVTLNFVADHTELATFLANDFYAIGMLPEPNVSVVLASNEKFRVALDMTEEWNKVAGEDNTLIQGVFIARKAFIKDHPAVVSAFLDDYNASQNLVNTNPEQGSKYIVDVGILAKEAIAKKALPGCNITFLEGEKMKSGVKKCLEVLFEAAPNSVGNALPADDFYYAR